MIKKSSKFWLKSQLLSKIAFLFKFLIKISNLESRNYENPKSKNRKKISKIWFTGRPKRSLDLNGLEYELRKTINTNPTDLHAQQDQNTQKTQHKGGKMWLKNEPEISTLRPRGFSKKFCWFKNCLVKTYAVNLVPDIQSDACTLTHTFYEAVHISVFLILTQIF